MEEREAECSDDAHGWGAKSSRLKFHLFLDQGRIPLVYEPVDLSRM